MALPENWDVMTATQSDRTTNEVREFINWSYDLSDSDFGYVVPDGESSIIDATFDFRVFLNINGGCSLENDYDGRWEGTITHRIVDISGEGRGFDSDVFKSTSSSLGTQEILMRDILGLSYVSANPDGTPNDATARLPQNEESLFGGYGPIIDSIGIKQEGDSPDVWLMSFKIKKFQISSWSLTPSDDEPESMRETPPWEQGPRVSVKGSPESYVLGLGYKKGEVTPTDIGTHIESGTIAGYFADVSGGSELEVVKNTAGDPFKSPPPTKIAIMSIQIDNAFPANENMGNFVSSAQAALSQVNSEDITLTSLDTGYSMPKGSAMCTSYGINPSVFNEKADWLPGQKHPFGKTYTQVGWTPPSNKTSTDVAVNPLKTVLHVNNAVSYKTATMTIAINLMGWGTFIPNKGYRQKLTPDAAPTEVTTKNKTSSSEVFLDAAGKKLDDSTNAVMVAYTPFKSSTDLATAISRIIQPTPPA